MGRVTNPEALKRTISSRGQVVLSKPPNMYKSTNVQISERGDVSFSYPYATLYLTLALEEVPRKYLCDIEF